jgi:hypothetical protein
VKIEDEIKFYECVCVRGNLGGLKGGNVCPGVRQQPLEDGQHQRLNALDLLGRRGGAHAQGAAAINRPNRHVQGLHSI